jgi:voltage-gated potassium channel
MTNHGFQERLHTLLDPNDEGLRAERIFNWCLGGFILISTLNIILESDSSLASGYSTVFLVIEALGLVVFGLEYLGRLYTAPLMWPGLGPMRARWRYTWSFFGLLDLLAWLPFLMALFWGFDSEWLTVLAVLRLLRIIKLSRFWPAVTLVSEVIWARRDELITAFAISGVLLVVSSTLMHLVERHAQPDKFGSIADSLWWGIVTLATIGYGDTFPITPVGKLMAGAMALVLLSVFALPTAILTAAFTEAFQLHRERRQT